MTEYGKHAEGLKGFPTPEIAADIRGYLLLYFPDKEWAQYALGALSVWEHAYNWYKAGEVDPDEAAELFAEILRQAPLNKLPTCSLPTGEPLMRVNPKTGKIQGVDEDGNWADDTTLPPPADRHELTDDEKKCLGAANTAFALQTLYENLTDSWAAGLSTAEAVTAFLTGIGVTLSAEFFPPAAALIAVGGVLFEIVYEVVQFVGADVWTEDFNEKLQCMLYACAQVEDDKVTYDFECVINQLAAQTNVFDLSFTQIRLFGQLYYILNFIGGNGLDYSSGATAITGATCLCAWCHEWDLTVEDGGLVGVVISGTSYGTWESGSGWRSTFFPSPAFNNVQALKVERNFTGAILTKIEWEYTFPVSHPNAYGDLRDSDDNVITTVSPWVGATTWDGVKFYAQTYPVGSTNFVWMVRLRIEGVGFDPFDGESTCP